jgi:hypothetical protein
MVRLLHIEGSEVVSDQEQSSPWQDPEFEQSVREMAYFLWENDGRPAGREQDYWFAALGQKLEERKDSVPSSMGMSAKGPHEKHGGKVERLGGASPEAPRVTKKKAAV